MYACLSECVLRGYRCLWRPERGLEFPGAGARAGDIHTIMSPWLTWQPGNELVLRKSSLYCWSIFLLSPNSFSLKGLKSQKHIFFFNSLENSSWTAKGEEGNYEIILSEFVQLGKSWLVFHVSCQLHQPCVGGGNLLLFSYFVCYS